MAHFYGLVRLVISLLVLRGRTDRSKDAEILVLRHQLAVLHRQMPRPRFEPTDRAILAAFARVLGRDCWSILLVKPDTIFALKLTDIAYTMGSPTNVGGPTFQTNVAVAALRGRTVSVGRMGGHDGTVDLDELARKQVSLIGVSFRTRTPQEIVDVYRRATADIVPALEAGRLHVVVDRSFAFGELLAAQDWMQTGRQIGKVVLTFD